MCGICGEISFDGQPASAARVERMTQRMQARGPDDVGLVARGRVAFGHRRLKIIDLSDAAAQPFTDAQLGLTIAFNGCIYNYEALREELVALGYSFASHGDTEVILKAWHAWGAEALPRFHGMFAFAIHERDTGRTAFVRDRFGIKPLYLAQVGKQLRFASTVQALVASGDVDTDIDRVALHHYMMWHAVVPPPRTIYKGVRKLPPATIRIIDDTGAVVSETTYWQPDFSRTREDVEKPFEAWRDEVLEALRLAVRRRMVADVPVGVLLSGGVDSSVIVGLLAEEGQQDLATYSIGFEEAHGEKGDEFQYSDLIARHYGTNHHKIFIPSSEMLENLPLAIAAMSEPMVSYDNIGFFLLSREVAKSIKVVQSGQGADEVFAGYHWYPPLANSNDPVSDYAAAFFDRSHQKLGEHLSQDYMADTDECIQLAIDYGAREDSGTRVAKDTARGAAIGGAAGTAVGAVRGNAGRGAAVGAAGGGAASMTRSALNSGKPDPVFKRFVEQCLRDKGYQPVGWR